MTLRSSLFMVNVTLDVVIQPPPGAGICFCVVFTYSRPSIVHFISAGGFDFAVVHVVVTSSSAFASFAPSICTVDGETVVVEL